MNYIISFLEGIITFISPSMLPLLPVYAFYFSGNVQDTKKSKALKNSIGFVLGYTVLFLCLGAFAGNLGYFIQKHITFFNFIAGLIITLFGLNYIGIFKIYSLKVSKQIKSETKNLDFFSSIIFGIIFSISWSPYMGTFLGSALMLAASDRSSVKGIFMLLAFSLGLGIPFIISAVLLQKLHSIFIFLNKNYKVISFISGIFLVIIGIFMMFGLFFRLLGFLTFEYL